MARFLFPEWTQPLKKYVITPALLLGPVYIVALAAVGANLTVIAGRGAGCPGARSAAQGEARTSSATPRDIGPAPNERCDIPRIYQLRPEV